MSTSGGEDAKPATDAPAAAPSAGAPAAAPSADAPDDLNLDLIRRRFLNVVGHALRTPMATLRGLVEVMDRTDDPEVRDAQLEPLLRAARRLEDLLDSVLVASDITTRLPTDAPTDLHVATIAREVWADLGHPSDLGTQGEVDAMVRMSPQTLRWLLRNVLDNHGRYADHDAGAVTMTVDRTAGGDTGGGRIRLDVYSPCPPLSDDDLRHAFELFYRGEHAVMITASGMGVGLTVARRLAEHGGGTIDLRNDDSGRGVHTILELPTT